MYLQINKKKFNLTKSPLIVGILNLTPDSFYDGNKYKSRYSILKRVEQIIKEGADILDIGAESTRPKSKRISLKTEKERVIIFANKKEGGVNININIKNLIIFFIFRL